MSSGARRCPRPPYRERREGGPRKAHTSRWMFGHRLAVHCRTCQTGRMRLADAEAVLQECKNRAESLLTIDDFSNRLLCFGMNVLPDKDLGDRFSSEN